MPLNPVDLANAGPWAVVVTIGVGIAIGAVRRWWAPGWLYVQERRDRQRAEEQAAANAKVLTRLARNYAALLLHTQNLDRSTTALLAEVESLRAELARERAGSRGTHAPG